MLKHIQLKVKVHLDKQLEYASTTLIKTLSIKTFCTSLENNAFSIKNI